MAGKKVKLFSSVIVGLIVLAGAALLGLKLTVGAVNFPVGSAEVDPDSFQSRVKVAEGFKINVYADDVPNARLMLITRSGDLLVANPSRDQIVLLKKDANRDGKHDGKKLLMEGLNSPNGMDFHEDWLYIAETDAIGRIGFDHAKGEVRGGYERVVTGLPGGGNHWKKTIRFGPDDLLYATFGSSCNVCIEKDPRRATMMRYQPDGSGEEFFATGLRNSANFDWSPIDGQIYATDNGRDLLGDDFPPCELNKVEQGKFYGWPFANGANIPDPDLGKGPQAAEQIALSVPPVHDFAAHNAPLGIEFLRSNHVPEDYRHSAIVALHGSWNRTEKDGYKVVSLHWNKDGSIEEKDFVWGFLENDQVIGRPAEVEEGLDGAIYISDDYAGAVYRVVRQQ